MHTSETIRGTASNHLANRRIVLGVSGSIAAVKTVELARELVRHGADVLPVMTPAACRIIHPDALHFATGNVPVTALSGAVEHVTEFGPEGDADLLLMAPTTANTLAKMALGIDDTALTTFASVALGASDPVLVAPAMHGPMEENPATRAHIEALVARGVRFVRPLYAEGKAKLAPVGSIVAEVKRMLGPGTLSDQRVLVLSGPGREPVDPVRTLSNRSSGQMGRAVAWAAHRFGAEVRVLTSDPAGDWPPGTLVEPFEGVRSLLRWLDKHDGAAPDLVLVPAALGDYAPVPAPTKLSSEDDRRTLALERLPKVLPAMRQRFPSARIVGWKLEDSMDAAIRSARDRLERYTVDAMVANSAETLGSDRVRAVIVSAADDHAVEGSKIEVAEAILERLSGRDPAVRRVAEAGR